MWDFNHDPVGKMPANFGSALTGKGSIGYWEVMKEVALVAEKARAELFVFAELSGIHGAMVNKRSFASTCCPEVTSSFTIRPEIGA